MPNSNSFNFYNMLVFRKSTIGLNWVFWTTFLGSALPKAFPASIMAACLHQLLWHTLSEDNPNWNRDNMLVEHPYAVGALIMLISFLIVFRAQQAYLRFSQAAEWLFHMESKLLDAVSQVIAFHKQLAVMDDAFVTEILHLASLSYALNALNLRKDNNHARLVPFDPDCDRHVDGDLTKMDTSLDPSSWRPQNPILKIYYACSMRADFDKYFAASTFPVYAGVGVSELKSLDRCPNSHVKANLVMNWLNEFVARAQRTGKLADVPPPIVSRVFQSLSEAMLGFNKARRVSEIAYPFVLAQLTDIFVCILAFLVVCLNISVVPSAAMGGVISALTTFGFVGLYEAARDVEDPFLFEPNDLPLRTMIYCFNHSLHAMVTDGESPRDFPLELSQAKAAVEEQAAEEQAKERALLQRKANKPMGSPSALNVGGHSAQNSPVASPSARA